MTSVFPGRRSEPASEILPKLAGLSCRDMLWAMQQVLGEDTVTRGLAALPEDVRRAYTDANALDWVDYEVVNRVRESIANEAGMSVDELLHRAIPVAVERTFTTVWKVFLRFTSDDALVTRTPSLYSRSRSAGAMRARMLGPGHGEAVVEGWPRMPAREGVILARSIETVLRLAGREDARAVSTSTPDGARIEIRWRR
jgi:hypothetical protein